MTREKSEWREVLSARRHDITSVDRETAAENAVRLISEMPVFKNAHEIACYYPFKHEFDCLPMIEKIWAGQKNCYLPVLGNETLRFVLYHEHMSLRLNRYHIPEPENDEMISIEKLDLVLLPLLGFDMQGHRLGMGAGYYDRTFQHKKKKPFLLGLGYEMQCVPDILQDSWDVALDGVLTEKRVILF